MSSFTNGDLIALAALCVSLVALMLSARSWSRSFRPIVTAMVRTHAGGNVSTTLNLVIQNSGAIPARNITFHIHDKRLLEAALEDPASSQRGYFLTCFDTSTRIHILQNGAETSCSFGFYNGAGNGFWKPHAEFKIWIRYEGWFGKTYCEEQLIRIADSNSFTGSAWG